MLEALKEAWLAKSRDATPEEVPVKHAKGWVVRWTARKTQGEVKVKHGDTYLGTPKGQSLRSLKAAERWLGLAPPTPAPSASASAATGSQPGSKAAAARLRERTSAALLGTLADYLATLGQPGAAHTAPAPAPAPDPNPAPAAARAASAEVAATVVEQADWAVGGEGSVVGRAAR